MTKRLTKEARAEFGIPNAGEGLEFELESLDGRTAFLIDANRPGKIKLTKANYQERYMLADILVRLDIDGPPHTNPTADNPPLQVLEPYNGVRIPCPHYHFFVQGYEDRWAVPASVVGLIQTTDLVLALREFMTHCGVQEVPIIQYPMQ